MRLGSRMSLEVRAKVSERTRAAMASPEVRARIRSGMQAAPDVRAEADRLWAAWSAARPVVRRDFLATILTTDNQSRPCSRVRDSSARRNHGE
jgi:hypothetical protein